MANGFAGEPGLMQKQLPRWGAYHLMAVRSDVVKSARSHFFDTSSWGEFCDVTLTLKQAWQPDRSGWVKIDDYRCRQAFRHFVNCSTERSMEPHFVDTASVFASYPYWKRVRSILARCARGSVGDPVDGIFIVRSSCPCTWMLSPLKN